MKWTTAENIFCSLVLHCISHAILYFPRGLSAKKEVEKQSRRVFLKQTGRWEEIREIFLQL
jgi:hypothetical protein